MNSFLTRHASAISFVLSGFDRLVFRGKIQALFRPRAMHDFLARAGIRLLDFAEYAKATSEALKAASLKEAHNLDRPVRYLTSPRISKEDLARTILAERPVDEGLVCAFTTVEPCTSFEYHRSKNPHERGLKPRQRKCLHIYKYYFHPLFGFLNVRIQTWFPFSIQVCLNGREWLARQLTAAGQTDFERHDNCFTRFEDPRFAQDLMNEQLNTNWKTALDQLASCVNPLHDTIFAPWPQSYYWCTYQSEWATDVAFESPAALAHVYPGLVQHALFNFHSPDVMRFLGRQLHWRYRGEVVTSFHQRPEGVRVKHWADGNSIKMYDKGLSLLRVETTIGNPTPYKAFRSLSNDPEGEKAWRPMRKSIADLHRRTQVSQHANEAYLEGLATKHNSTPVAEVFDAVSMPRLVDGRRVRPLRLNDPGDVALLDALSRGEFALAGFRNKDLRMRIHATSPRSVDEQRRQSAKTSRQLRLLRDHGLIRKVPKSYRYRLTDKGRLLVTALQAVRKAPLERLDALAA